MAALGIAAFALTGLCMCGEGSHEIWRDAGAGGSVPLSDAPVADGDVDTGPAWDPVWHETEPKDWPTVSGVELPLCGDGCRIGLHVKERHPFYYGHAYTTNGIAGVNTDVPRRMFYAPLDHDATFVVGETNDPNEGFVEPSLCKDILVFLKGSLTTRREIGLMNVRTGETKSAYTYIQQSSDDETSLTALNETHAFWYRDKRGLMVRDLQTGSVQTLGSFGCDRICATKTGLLCFASPNLFIDQETGEATVIDSGGALQTDASCSPARDRTIWVDYRDPPGQGSDWFGSRNGGEVYMKDLPNGQVLRLTNDSPGGPRSKAFPAVGQQLAVWKEVPDGMDPNPATAQDVYASTWDLVVLDLDTKARCKIHSELVEYFTFMSVHDRWVYGKHYGYIIGIDIDHPAIGCEPY